MDCETTTENRPQQTLAGILKFKTRYHSKFLNRFWARHRRQHHHQKQQQVTSQGTSYARLNTSRNSVITIENQNYGKSVLPKDAIQMQCLDVGSLLKMNERRDYKRLQCESLTEGTLSFAGSSLDLEWEHEYDADEQQDDDPDEARHSWFQSDEESSSSSSEANGRSIELSQFSTPSQKLNKQNNNCCPSMNTAAAATQWQGRHHRREIRARSRNESSRSTSMTKLDGDNKSKPNTNWSHTSTPDSLEWDAHADDRKFKSEEDSLDQETVDLLNEIEWLKNRALIETGDTQWNPKHADS